MKCRASLVGSGLLWIVGKLYQQVAPGRFERIAVSSPGRMLTRVEIETRAKKKNEAKAGSAAVSKMRLQMKMQLNWDRSAFEREDWDLKKAIELLAGGATKSERCSTGTIERERFLENQEVPCSDPPRRQKPAASPCQPVRPFAEIG